MMRRGAAFALLIGFTGAAAVSGGGAQTDAERFEGWKRKHGRQYTSRQEEETRLVNFRRTLLEIEEQAAANPLATFAPGKWADLSEDEKRSLWPALPAADDDDAETAPLFTAAEVARAEATTIDWRQKGAVTPVKDQVKGGVNPGSCGCFSSTGNMEGQWFLANANNTLIELSEQELLSCNGCGWQGPILKWVLSNHGVASEKAWPYTAKKGECTSEMKKQIAATFTGYKALPKDEGQILAYMQQNGPVSIALNCMPWSNYKGGILSSCADGSMNHAIILVGYGTSPTKYWIIKNSHGTNFGEDGYIKIKYGSNQCGLLGGRPASIIAKPLPPPTRYHCAKSTQTCALAQDGHSTEAKCKAACNPP